MKKTLFLYFFTSLYISIQAQYNLTTDSLALVDFYHNTGGEFWSNSTNWLTNAPINTWRGVRLTSNGTRINALNLNDNNLIGVLPSSFSNLTSLKSLNISDNSLTSIQNIEFLSALKTLVCFTNELDSLPDLSNLINLETLRCENNYNLKKIEGLQNLVNLKTLTIQNTSIDALPDLSTFPLLKTLNCNNTQITNLKGLDANLNLTELSCSNLGLMELPDLSNLTSLKELICSTNNLSELNGLQNLTNLMKLECHENNLDTLLGVENIATLVELQIQQNSLCYLPDFSNLENLEVLRCNNNPLKQDTIYGLENLTKLTTVVLSNLGLKSIPDLSNAPNLLEYNCNDNNLNFAELEKIFNHPNSGNPGFKTSYKTQTLDSLFIEAQELFYVDENTRIGRTYIDSTYTFTATDVGGDSTYYWWYKDNDNNLLKRSQEPFLKIDTVTTTDRGDYYYKVNNTIVPGIINTSILVETYVYGIDSLGGLYYPNQYVVQFAQPLYDWEAKQIIREEFNATVLDSCMCGQQIELWEIPSFIQLEIDGETQNVHDDNTKRRRARERKNRLNGCDFNYIVNTDGMPSKSYRSPSNQSYYNYLSNRESEGVKIAILDSGLDVFDESAVLYPLRWENPDEEGNDNDGNCYENDEYGMYVTDKSAHPDDDHYNRHGSNIGRLVAQGLGSSDIDLIPIKTHDAGGWGSLFESVCGVYYAKEKGAKLMNASWSYQGEPSTILYNALKLDTIEQRTDDFLFFTSAGNRNQELKDSILFYPAAYDHDHIVAVMAVDDKDSIPDFSNYGFEHIDLAALGADIPSFYTDTISLNGTSMSTAYVTGFAARLLIEYPDLNYQQLKDSIFARLQFPTSLEGKCSTNGRLPKYLYEPIQFIGLNANPTSDRVILDWETQFEIDILGFDVEGSADNITFSKIGFVEANNLSQNNYQFIDWCPHGLDGERFYRIKAISSEDEIYSNVERVKINEIESAISILSNTTEQSLDIVFRGSYSEGVLEIYDTTGKLWLSYPLEGEKGTIKSIDLARLAKGIYLGRVLIQGNEQVFKFLYK